MKWFNKWFAKKCKQAWEESRETDSIPSVKLSRGNDIDYPDAGLNIQVKSAIGGKIVIFKHYDQRTDRHSYTTYIINSEENFTESLGKIITTESLKL